MANSESKHQRFKRLATQRTNSVLERIRVLGNCANRNDYDYTKEDAKRIFGAIEKELKKVKDRFMDDEKLNHKFSL